MFIYCRFSYYFLLCRFWGGYSNIEYGYIHDTYSSLTGGIYDAINLEKTRLKPGDIYFRIRRAISQGAIVGCAVSVSHQNNLYRDNKMLIR